MSEMGFKLADDFNLANDEEYAYIRNKLIEYKSNLVGLAASDISTVNNANPVVKERYDKVENTRAALVQDQEAGQSDKFDRCRQFSERSDHQRKG